MARDLPDQTTTLHYVDKAYESMTKVWALASRMALLSNILSLLLLVLALGIVSVDETFSFVGLELRVSTPILLWGGAIVLCAVVVCRWAAERRGDGMTGLIELLYRRIDYPVNPQPDSLNPFGSTDALKTIANDMPTTHERGDSQSQSTRVAGAYATIIAGLILGVVTFLPATVEVVVMIKVGSLVGWHKIWAWAPMVLFVLISISAPLAYQSRPEPHPSADFPPLA